MRLASCLWIAWVVACGGAPPGSDAGDAPPSDAPPTDAPPSDAPPSDAPLTDAPGPPPGTSLATLFIGNSYVFVNDVPAHVRALLARQVETLRIESVTAGGYTLAQHATDADTDGAPLAVQLRTGPLSEHTFDFVILQEQSQIGGFPEGNPDRVASLAAARRLGALAMARGAEVVLYVTWGRARGDELNPDLFPTFEAMQDALDAGYAGIAAALRGDGITVRLAPVGPAFRVVHDDIVDAGLDPLAPGSDFIALYEPDGSHPSARGAYLAACVLATTMVPGAAAAFPDDLAIGPEISGALRSACARAVADPP